MTESKKRKIVDECRQFQEEWNIKYFFAKHGDKALCVICNETVSVMKDYNLRRHYQSKHEDKYGQLQGKERNKKFSKLHHQLSSQKALFCKLANENESITNASYKVAYILVKRGKPFTDGELVKECMLEVVQELCPEMIKKITNISLSPNTMARRVEDIGENIMNQVKTHATNFRYFSIAMDESLDISSTSQLLMFIRGVDENMKVTQELAALHSMYDTVTGEHIFNKMLNTFSEYNLEWSNLSCVTVDGGRNMSGTKKGLVGQVKEECKKRKIPQPMFVHCMIHQEALCAKYLDISCVLQPVVKIVNFIRSHGLNHRQFRNMLKDNDADYLDLPYYTAVRWLSCGKLLTSMLELRKYVVEFLDVKGKQEPLLRDENWIWKLAFAADITNHLNVLNLKLQGQDNLISDLYTHIKAFRSKLRLFIEQLQVKKLTHFPECQKFQEDKRRVSS